MSLQPLSPARGESISITVGSSSQATVLPTSTLNQLLLTNLGDGGAFYILLGDDSAEITSVETPILPNSQIVISRNPNQDTHIATQEIDTGGTLIVTLCEGF